MGRAAVLRAPSRRPDDTASQLADDLRAARYMAIEMDPAKIDPFADAYLQWDNVAKAGAYNVVFSVGGLLPAAVALGVVSRLPVVVVNHPPGRALGRLLRGEMAPRTFRTVLEATVDRTRRLTVSPMEVHASEVFTADLHQSQKGRAVQATWLQVAPSDPATGLAAVVTTDDGLQVSAESCQLAERRGVMLQVGIDGRWSHARSLAVRARPEPLQVVALEGDT